MKNRTLLNPRSLVLLAAGYAIYSLVKKGRQQVRISDIDYGDEMTYVIGHKSPDADCIASAIAYAKLLNELGIKAKALSSANVNNETRYFMEKFELPLPEIMNVAKGEQFVLVDHSSYIQGIKGLKESKILTVIDHHEKGDVLNDHIPLVRIKDVGASATIICRMFKEYNIPIDRDTARALFMGIISDTKNLSKSNTTYFDRKAYTELAEIGDIHDIEKIYQGMIDASMSYEGMSDKEILHSDLKEYETDGLRYCLATATARNHVEMIDLVNRMYDAAIADYENMDLDYVFIKVRDDQSNKMYMAAIGEGAVELLDSIYCNYDGDRYFVFDVSLSRKLNIVPMIDLAIKERNSKGTS